MSGLFDRFLAAKTKINPDKLQKFKEMCDRYFKYLSEEFEGTED
jgi:hypothetical protein